MTEAKSSNLKAPLYLGLVRVSSQTGAFFVFLLGARFLSIEELGTFALASALSMLLAQLAWVGFHQYALREKCTEKTVGKLLAVTLTAGLALSALNAAIAYPSSLLFELPQINELMLWWSVIPLSTAFQAVVIALHYNANRFKVAAIISIAAEAIALTIALYGFSQGWGLETLLVHRLALAVMPIIPLWLSLDGSFGFSAGSESVRNILKFVTSFTGGHIVNFGGTYGADLTLGLVAGPAAAGAYRFGARIVLVMSALIDQPLVTLGWTELAKKKNDPRRLGPLVDKFLSIALFISVASFVGLAIVAEPFVVALAGEKWAVSVVVVQILALTYTLRVPLEVTLQPALGVVGQEWWLPTVSLLTAAISIAAVLALAPFGIVAVATAQAIVLAGLAPLAVWLMHRYVALSVSLFLRSLMITGLCASIMWTGIFFLKSVLGSTNDWLVLVAVVPAGALIFIASAMVLAPTLTNELMHLVRRTAPNSQKVKVDRRP